MIEMKGRSITETVQAKSGQTLLEVALQNGVDWGYNCTRGTCARCRCHIPLGMEELSAPTKAELDRLEPEEIEEGFRLACQTEVHGNGELRVVFKPYF